MIFSYSLSCVSIITSILKHIHNIKIKKPYPLLPTSLKRLCVFLLALLYPS